MNNEPENMKSDLDEDWTVNEPNFQSKQAADFVNDGEVLSVNPQNQANSDDWAMNTIVSNGNILDPPDQANSAYRTAEMPNTNPLNKKQDKWQMPEPEFRVSSGKKVEKSASPMPRLDFSAKVSEISKTTNSVADIQPQPYISEALIVGDENIIESSPAEVKSGTGRTILIVAGILAMVLFAVGFLIGIYFLFFHQLEL